MPFKPGQSGNPHGRKPLSNQSVASQIHGLIEKRSDKLYEVKDFLESRSELGKFTASRLIAVRLVCMAIEGNMDAIKTVLERVDGKVRDESQMVNAPVIALQTNVHVTIPGQSAPLQLEANTSKQLDE